MKQIASLLLTVALVWSARPLSAQIQPDPQTINVQDAGVVCSLGTSCAIWSLPTQPTVTITITGTCSCTLTFETTADGANWFAVAATNISTGTAATTTTTTGQYSVANTGVASLRVRAGTFASGSLTLRARQGYSSLARGGSGSGTVTSIATTSPITGGTITTTGTIACATCGVTSTGLSQFASTTSAELAALLSNETGTTLAVFNTGPTLVAPVTVTGVVGSSALTLGGATQTASFPVIDATQTWNNAGVTFTGLKLNVTSTASAGGSLLLDLQVGSSSVFKVDKLGQVTSTTSGTFVDLFATGGSNNIANTTAHIAMSGTAKSLIVGSDASVGFISAASYSGTIDAAIVRDAANTIGFRNSTNAQRLNVYNTFTSVSVFEDVSMYFSSNVAHIGTATTGGTARVLQVDYGGTTTSAISIPITSGDITLGGSVFPTGYKSADGTAGATVTTCTGFKNGLCISGT